MVEAATTLVSNPLVVLLLSVVVGAGVWAWWSSGAYQEWSAAAWSGRGSSAATVVATITQLWVFPIKGCAGVRVTEAACSRLGFVHDRCWMVIDEGDQAAGAAGSVEDDERVARFRSQRDLPRMCLIRTALNAETRTLTVDAPHMPTLAIPFVDTDDACATWAPRTTRVRVWKDVVLAHVYADAAIHRWFTLFLGVPCRLVAVANTHAHDRPVSAEWDSQRTLRGTPTHAAFSDGFPYLIASESSLRDLNRRMDGRRCMPIHAFRPNIVVDACVASGDSSSGECSDTSSTSDRINSEIAREKDARLPPWSEDTWRMLTIEPPPSLSSVSSSSSSQHTAPLIFHASKPCSRCTVTLVDPTTGVRDSNGEPLQTLRALRALNPDKPTDVYFGVNLVHRSAHGRVRVGDRVVVRSFKQRTMERPAEWLDQ